MTDDNMLPAIVQPEVALTATPADENPALVYLASLGSPASRRTMRQALEVIAQLVGGEQATAFSLPWAVLRFQHTAAIRARLAETYRLATANKLLSALRGVLLAACNLGQMSADDYQRAIAFKRVKGETLPAGRELKPGEIRALAEACIADPFPAGARDAALLGVLYTGGLRRAELVALDLADLEVETGKLIIRSGKGSKARTAYVGGGALAALTAWLRVRGEAAGPLFLRILKGGHLTGQRLTTQAVYTILKVRAIEAGVKDFSPMIFAEPSSASCWIGGRTSRP